MGKIKDLIIKAESMGLDSTKMTLDQMIHAVSLGEEAVQREARFKTKRLHR